MSDKILIESDDYGKVASSQAVVESAVRYDGESARVLSATATAFVRPGELFTGEARYLGRVLFNVAALVDGKVEFFTTVAEFSDKITSSAIVTGMVPYITCEVIECDSKAEPGAIKLTAVLNIDLYAAVHCAVEAVEGFDGAFTDTQTIECSSVVAQPCETAYITDTIPNIKAESAKGVVSRAVVSGVACTDNEISISGAVYSTVVVQGDDGLPAVYRAVTPFVKSVGAPGVSADCTAVAKASVSESSVALVENEDSKSLELAVTLETCSAVFKRQKHTVAADAFSPDCELQLKSGNIKSADSRCVTVFDSIDGQVPLDSDKPEADSVLFVGNTYCNISTAVIEDDRPFTEGVVGGDIVYYNAEKSVVESQPFRLPFAIPLSVDTNAKSIGVTGCVTDVSVRVRRESVFDVKAEVAFELVLSTADEYTVISDIACGAQGGDIPATVVVHVAKPGETLWQAAKAVRCDPELVAKQNPDANSPFAGGERLVCFLQRQG